MCRTTDQKECREILTTQVVAVEEFLGDIDSLLEDRRQHTLHIRSSKRHIQLYFFTALIFAQLSRLSQQFIPVTEGELHLCLLSS